jgi:hypothetical protein
MPYTQADADAIKEAIASGAYSVKYADKEVVYKSTDALRTALTLIEAELNPKPRRTRTHGVYYKNGC